MRRHPRNAGFALLITVTLLGFLVLLMVAFASLTRVETQAAGNIRQFAQARQNAVTALTIAIGQLQQLAGPDQRATATAEIAGNVQNGTRVWTGVWGNGNASDDYVSSPRHLGWLVSGNENTAFEASADAADFGRIKSAATPAFGPGDTVALGAVATAGALATDVKIKNRDARLLLGPGGVDLAADYVVAPLVELTAEASSIPGLSGGASTTIGRYAWWVGDEGVKARFNLVDPWAGASNATERFRRLQVAQRHGIELMTRDGATVLGASVYPAEGPEPTRSAFLDSLSRTISRDQAGLLDGFATEDMAAALRRLRHDLTFVSSGVVADQLRGGLRKDLTVLFDTAPSAWTGSLKSSLDRVGAHYAGARRIADFQAPKLYGAAYSMASSVSPDFRVPQAVTWEQLRSFYHLKNVNSGTLGVTAPSDDQMGIFPLVTRWGISFDLTAAAGGGGTLHLFPHVVLWNPYNVTLQGSYRVRLEFATDSNNDTTSKYLYFITPRRESDGTPLNEIPYEVYHHELIVPALRPGTGKYGDRTLEFTIDSVSIPPGAAYVFSAKNTRPYSETNIADNRLAPGYRPSASFTRPVSHTFTPEQVEDSALVLANVEGGKGGTASLHLLTDAGDPLQIIDSPGMTNQFCHVSRNDGVAPIAVTRAENNGFGGFRDLSAGTPGAENQVGITFLNSLQCSDSRFNWLAQVNQRAPSIGKTWFEWNSGFAATVNWASKPPRASGWDIDIVASDSKRTYTGPNHGPSFDSGNSPRPRHPGHPLPPAARRDARVVARPASTRAPHEHPRRARADLRIRQLIPDTTHTPGPPAPAQRALRLRPVRAGAAPAGRLLRAEPRSLGPLLLLRNPRHVGRRPAGHDQRRRASSQRSNSIPGYSFRRRRPRLRSRRRQPDRRRGIQRQLRVRRGLDRGSRRSQGREGQPRRRLGSRLHGGHAVRPHTLRAGGLLGHFGRGPVGGPPPAQRHRAARRRRRNPQGGAGPRPLPFAGGLRQPFPRSLFARHLQPGPERPAAGGAGPRFPSQRFLRGVHRQLPLSGSRPSFHRRHAASLGDRRRVGARFHSANLLPRKHSRSASRHHQHRPRQGRGWPRAFFRKPTFSPRSAPDSPRARTPLSSAPTAKP